MYKKKNITYDICILVKKPIRLMEFVRKKIVVVYTILSYLMSRRKHSNIINHLHIIIPVFSILIETLITTRAITLFRFDLHHRKYLALLLV